MKALPLALCAALALTPALAEGYDSGSKSWQLTDLDGHPFTARATLHFGENGALSGAAPCNRFFGQHTAPYPVFSAGRIGATRMACPDLAAETRYLTALRDMTTALIEADTLTLSNPQGRSMVFTRIPTPY